MITIITPIHKKEFLQNVIDNFNRQQYKNKELLLICNGELYGYNNDNYNCVSIDSCNIASIRNVGLNWMKENKRLIFSFFDSDDLYEENYLEEQINKLKEGYDLVGKLDYKFKFKDDIYHVFGLNEKFKDTRQIHGPTITGYLSELRFNEFYSHIGEDRDFVHKHNKIGRTSADNWIYTVREDSIQKRTFNCFITQLKYYNTYCDNKEFKIYKKNELYFSYGDDYNLEDMFK